MGKYPNSKIHELYSDFHWKLIELDDRYKRLYTSDIDRLWLEYDFERKEVVGVLDIKWMDSGDTVTPTENGIYEWFVKNNVRIFIVYIDKEFTKFKVINEKGIEKEFNQIQYAEFLLSLRSDKKLQEFIKNHEGYIELDNG